MALYNWFKHLLQPASLTGRLVRKYSTKSIVEKKYGAVVTREISASSTKPLVVILGWNDCKVKYLQKYSVLFENKGWPTICLPTKSFNTFLRSGTKVKTISYHMIDLIKELTVNEKPVLFYSFSNGGCAVYFHIAEALTTPNQENFNAFKIAGSIFDSCPTKPNMESILRAQISITVNMRNPVLRVLAWYASGIAIPFVVKQNPLLARFFQDLGHLSLDSPELYLYSKSDQLSLFGHIEEHISNRKSQDVEVISKCWDGSSHVAHYTMYPEEYIEQIENFLKVCSLTKIGN